MTDVQGIAGDDLQISLDVFDPKGKILGRAMRKKAYELERKINDEGDLKICLRGYIYNKYKNIL